MTGTITRLLDNRQRGWIAAEDGHDYVFAASALRGIEFYRLSLGTRVTFTPRHTDLEWQAESVRLA